MMIELNNPLFAIGTLERVGLLVLGVFVLLVCAAVLVLWLDKPITPQRRKWKPSDATKRPALNVQLSANLNGVPSHSPAVAPSSAAVK